MEESRVSGKVSMARTLGKRTHWYPRKREGLWPALLKGVEGEIFTEHGVKIRLKFGKHSFPGRNDQYVAKLLFSVHKGTSFPAKKW